MARRIVLKSVFDKKLGKMVDVTHPEVKEAAVKLHRESVQRRRRRTTQTVVPTAKAKWPMTSIRGGVHPDQAEAMNKRLAAEGIVNSRFDLKTGDATWGSALERRKVLKIQEQRDFSGYD